MPRMTTPACAPRIISTPTSLLSPKRAPLSSTKPATPRRCSKPCRRPRQRDAGYIFSRIQWLRRGDKIAEAGRWMAAAPRDAAELRDSTNGGSSGGSSRASCSTSAIPNWPMRSPAAPRRRPTRTIAPSSNSPPAGLRCASCTSPPSRSRHFARIAEGVSNPITLARSFYWQGRAAEAPGTSRTRAPITKRRRAIRPPITANWRGRGSVSMKSRCGRRRSRQPISAASKSRACSRFSTPSMRATSSPPWRPTSPTRRPTPARWRRWRRSRHATTMPARRC